MKENYEHLIISVGSSFKVQDNSYQNRGILRNPISILEGNYKGISMALHGFSALIAENEFGKTSMHVNPMSAMYEILKNSLPEDAFLHVEESKLGGDSITHIKISALSKCFLDAKNKSQDLEKTNSNEKANSWQSRTGNPSDPDKPKGTGSRYF